MSLGGLGAFALSQYVSRVSAGELERKARFAELLLEAARELGDGLEPERVYERFRELLVGVIPYDERALTDAMSEAQLERLYAGLTRIAALPPNELQALVESLLADKEHA